MVVLSINCVYSYLIWVAPSCRACCMVIHGLCVSIRRLERGFKLSRASPLWAQVPPCATAVELEPMAC